MKQRKKQISFPRKSVWLASQTQIKKLRFAQGDEVASLTYKKTKTPSRLAGRVVELLARFELATSSLPRMRSTD